MTLTLYQFQIIYKFSFSLLQKIQILRGDCKLPNMKFFPTNDKNLLKVELQILKDTEVKSWDEFDPQKEGIQDGPTEVDFNSIIEAEGNIGLFPFLL